jgi:hypothetical protein
MNIKTLTLAVLVFSSTQLMATNHMVIMGGSGDAAGPKTIFDHSMGALGNLIKDSSWKYQVSFNGGHSETEALLHSQFNKGIVPTSDFTKESYDRLLETYKKKINSGEIKSGDQLVIIIEGHGAEKNQYQKTHHIAVNGGDSKGITNYDKLDGAKAVNLDTLEELVKLTTKKGIKLGLIDMSCHSGNSQALKMNAPNACIVTSTGTNHYAMTGPSSFSGKFWAKAKPGMNLEDVFLQARVDSTEPGFPMISTKESNEITAELYKKISPYLYYVSPNADKLTKYLKNNSSDQLICQRQSDFRDLNDKISRLQNTVSDYDGTELKNLLAEYKTQQDEMTMALNKLGGSVGNKVEKFESSNGKAKFSIEFTWKDLVGTTPDSAISFYEGAAKSSKNASEKAENKAIADTWKKIKVKREQIIINYPQLKDLDHATKELTKKIGNNFGTAIKIANQEKIFYNTLYEQKKQSGSANDPCRSIVF